MSEKRRDNRNRILREGEYQRKDGRYRFRYIDEDGKEKNVYSWRLDKNDPMPKGKKREPSLREKEKENAPEKAENQMEKETGENVRTETVVLPEGKIEFELDDAEEMFQIGDEAFPEGNFTHAQEGKAKNPSEPFSRNKNISSGRETSWEEKNEKPSVRKELGDIRKEQEEKRKRPDRRKNARESRKKRKNMKTKGR